MNGITLICSLVLYQIPQAPPVKEGNHRHVQATKTTSKNQSLDYTYSDAAKTARIFKSSLVVWVDCKPINSDYENWVFYEATTKEWFSLTGETIRGIVVSVPRDNATWFERGRDEDGTPKTLPSSSSKQDILIEIRRLKSMNTQPTIIRSPTQIIRPSSDLSFPEDQGGTRLVPRLIPEGRIETLFRVPFQPRTSTSSSNC